MTRMSLNRGWRSSPSGQDKCPVDRSVLPDVLNLILDHVWVLPRRMQLQCSEPEMTVPLLRGVWGRQIHDRCLQLYRQVFDVPSQGGAVANSPLYLLRPAPPDPEWAPAIEYFLFCSAIEHSHQLDVCWEAAGRAGIGRSRLPFQISRAEFLLPDGSTSEHGGSWPVSAARWPLPADRPCKLVFPSPVRIRRDNRLVSAPTLADLVAAFNRRVAGFLPARYHDLWRSVGAMCVALAKDIPQRPWQGERLDLVRYSARQRADLELQGVTGELALPRGPQELAPLIAAMQWLHVGKSTVMGLGQPLVAPLE
ncbi:MAG: hypothetical protein KatS3mg111_0630 [Pirellulaceae bacterium]|nr:MAG: hypothetical protein KatS3mg111_0630 [Pirellulaceae bacterium]